MVSEIEDLRAEVERMKRQDRGQTTAAKTAWRAADASRERADGLQRQVNAWFARAEAAEAECATLRARLAAVEAVLPGECWTSRTVEVHCSDYVGAAFPNGAPFTEEMVCLPCRVRAALAPEPVIDEGLTVVAATTDGGERWTEYGVQADDGSVRWVYSEEGLARVRAGMGGGSVVSRAVRADPWLPVDVLASVPEPSEPVPSDEAAQLCRCCGTGEATAWNGDHCADCCPAGGVS